MRLNTSKSRPLAGILATTTVATLVLAGCGGNDSSSSGSPTAKNPYGLIQAGVLNAVTDTSQPPFASADADGKPQGFIIDVANEIAKRLGLRVTYKSSSVSSALSGLTSGQYDLAASGLGVTAERQKTVAFTKPLYWSTTAVLTTTASNANAAGDFSGKKVGVVTGAVQETFIKTKMPGAIATKFQSSSTGITQLLNSNIDAFVLGGPDAQEYLKQYAKLRVAVSAPVDHPTAMALPKKDTALQAAMDQQIGAIVRDGTFATMYRKYFVTAPAPELIDSWPALKAQFPAAG
jgi:polar amino acid transport system substrate-binding protein